MHVCFPPVLYQQCHASRLLDPGICGFPTRFPTGLIHVSPWWESILGVKVGAVQGKQVPLELTESSGGLWEWCHEAGVFLAFPVEIAST